MSAVFASGKVRQLDKLSRPDDQITEEQVKDPERLSRMMQDILRNIAKLQRRWSPRFAEHEDVQVDGTGTTKYRFAHRFGKRVRWWPVDWADATGGAQLVEHSDTDENTLVLVSYEAGTVTLRIEEAG